MESIHINSTIAPNERIFLCVVFLHLGMRQGNDQGTQYRSGIYYYTNEQRDMAQQTKEAYQKELNRGGHGKITTEIEPAGEFYYAEDYHQQYLHKNPNGYCGMGGTGVTHSVTKMGGAHCGKNGWSSP